MAKFSRSHLFIITAFFLVGSFLLVKFSLADATSTVRGKAWWGDSLGYVYFSCYDDEIGDRLDVPGNLYTPPELAFHFYSVPCSYLVHGVFINQDGLFSGQAWNQSEGLISFEYEGVDPPGGYGSFNSVCATCNPSTNCIACYIESQQKVYGWARTAAGDWIRLDPPSNPVKIQSWDLSNPVFPGEDVDPGDFVGTASSSLLGGLSFNCKSEAGGNACSTRDYKVYIGGLSIGKLSAPNWTYTQACNSTARGAVLRWYRKSGQQSAYEIIINDSPTFSTSSADYVCWTDVVPSSGASQYTIPNANCSLNYNTNYYWWIRLFDEDGEPTELYQFGQAGIVSESTDGNPDGNSNTFTTYKHEFPNPFFSWVPEEIVVGTTTTFTSASSYYTTASPSSSQACVDAACSYLWTTDDLLAVISSPTASKTDIVFAVATGTTIYLRVTDVDNYYCSTSTTIRINYGLPLWREVKPE